jgi:hypothetical protein
MGVVHPFYHHHPDGEIRQNIEYFFLNRKKHVSFFLFPLTLLLLKVNPSTPRPEGRGLLSLPAGRQGLTLSAASLPRLQKRGLAPPNGSTNAYLI